MEARTEESGAGVCLQAAVDTESYTVQVVVDMKGCYVPI